MRHVYLPCVVVLAGCTVKPAFSPEQGKVVAQECINQVGASRTYSILAGQPSTNPEGAQTRARPVERLGGTASGAAAINACIQRRAAS